jgi:hypothetical protein
MANPPDLVVKIEYEREQVREAAHFLARRVQEAESALRRLETAYEHLCSVSMSKEARDAVTGVGLALFQAREAFARV